MPSETYIRCEKCKKYYPEKEIMLARFVKKSWLPFTDKVDDIVKARCKECLAKEVKASV